MRFRCVWLSGRTFWGVGCLTPGVACLSKAGPAPCEEEWPAEAGWEGVGGGVHVQGAQGMTGRAERGARGLGREQGLEALVV